MHVNRSSSRSLSRCLLKYSMSFKILKVPTFLPAGVPVFSVLWHAAAARHFPGEITEEAWILVCRRIKDRYGKLRYANYQPVLWNRYLHVLA